jgi:uncharacterized membrane protein
VNKQIEARTDEVRELLQAVNVAKPTREALAAYRTWLAENPTAWRKAGDLAEMAEGGILSSVNAPAIVTEGARVGAAAIRTDLGYDTAPMLERLLIEQIALCWMRHNLLEYHYTAKVMSSATYVTETGDYWERRLTFSQRRYIRAVEALARVRRLAHKTPLQVNIAGQQVNVAGDVAVCQEAG